MDYQKSLQSRSCEINFSLLKIRELSETTHVFNPPNNAQSPLLRMFAKPLLSTPLSYMFFESSVSVAANFSGACNRSFKRIHSSSISCFLV